MDFILILAMLFAIGVGHEVSTETETKKPVIIKAQTQNIVISTNNIKLTMDAMSEDLQNLKEPINKNETVSFLGNSGWVMPTLYTAHIKNKELNKMTAFGIWAFGVLGIGYMEKNYLSPAYGNQVNWYYSWSVLAVNGKVLPVFGIGFDYFYDNYFIGIGTIYFLPEIHFGIKLDLPNSTSNASKIIVDRAKPVVFDNAKSLEKIEIKDNSYIPKKEKGIDKIKIGFGLGLKYGVLGVNTEYQISEHYSVYGGIGFMGANAGIKYFIQPHFNKKDTGFYLSMNYGYFSSMSFGRTSSLEMIYGCAGYELSLFDIFFLSGELGLVKTIYKYNRDKPIEPLYTWSVGVFL